MIRVNNIHLSLDYDDKSVRKAVAQQLRIEEKSIKSCKIFRRSENKKKNTVLVVFIEFYKHQLI